MFGTCLDASNDGKSASGSELSVGLARRPLRDLPATLPAAPPAAKYPGSSITAVSNSRTQRAHITAEAE